MSLGLIIALNGNPDAELATASAVEVHETAGDITEYTIRFNADISEGDLPILIDDRLDAGSEISVLVPVDTNQYCLVKGPVRSHTIHFNHGGAGSWLEVKGTDTSITMDRVTQSTVWSDMKDSDAVSSILENYGYQTDLENTLGLHPENKHTLVQRETDLSFMRRLARRNGFNFWITSDASGIETAHFKRPELDNIVSAELIINLESSNLDTLDIDWDVEHPTSIAGKQLDLNNKTDIDIAVNQTPQTILGSSGISAITGDTRSVHLSAPADDAGDLQSRGEGALIEADWFLYARCQTTLENTGKLVRANTTIELKGAGSRYSGKYFVKSVVHRIDAIEHLMEIELIRNGWG